MLEFIHPMKLSYYIRELGLSPQASYNLQRDLMSLGISLQREREKLKKEITDDVLKQISIQVNSGDAIKEINGLQQAIEKLKGGK